MNWEEHFWTIYSFATNKKNISIDLDGVDNCIDINNKIIELDKKNQDFEIKTYILLHELGHFLLSKSKYKNILLSSSQRNKKKYNSNEIVLIVEEEFLAWERAYKLGKRNNIPINLENWNKEKTKALLKYFNWAIKESK